MGPDIVARYAIVDHDSDGPDHVSVGEVDGVPILLDRHYVEADVRIITGFVEPHFFAGCSGGPKAVCPGLAATATILEAHSPRRIADPRATLVTREGNPVHDFVRAAVRTRPAAPLGRCDHQPGPPGHGGLRRTARRGPRCRLRLRPGFGHPTTSDAAFDVVVSTNGGYPLDRNLYQAVKGMAAAERVVPRRGDHRDGGRLRRRRPGRRRLRRDPGGSPSADDLIDARHGAELDRWQAQVLGRVLRRAEVWLRSEGLTRRDGAGRPPAPGGRPDHGGGGGGGPTGRRGPGRVLPEGPLTVATLTPSP